MSITLPVPTAEVSEPELRAKRSFIRAALSIGIVGGAAALAVLAHPSAAAVETEDRAGRVGFVALVAAALGLVWLLDARARRRIVPSTEVWVPTNFIVALFGVFAAMWLFYSHLVLDAFARGRFGYLEWLTQVSNLATSHGSWNVWTPYPQGTQELITSIQAAANALASLASSDIWTSYSLFRVGFEIMFLVGPSIVSIWLVGVCARAFGKSIQSVAAITLALSFGVVYYGAASAYVTDPLPAMLGLAAVAAVLHRKFALAGLAIGLGTALKLFPILLLPALVVLLPRAATLRMGGVAAAVVAVSFGPGLLANSDIFMSPINWQSGRPPWESWYAFVNWVTTAPHDYPQAYFQDAAVGSAFSWVYTGITPLVSVLQTPVPPGPLRWENVVSAVGVVLALLACLAARRGSGRAIVRWSLFCLSSFMFFGIGWSPQYELYLIPFILLAFDDPFVGAAAALALQAVTFLDYPLLLPWAYFYGGSAVWLEWGSVLARYVILGWLCVCVIRSEASLSALRVRLRQIVRLRRSSVVVLLACLPLTTAAAPADQGAALCAPLRVAPARPGGLTDSDWSVPGGWFFSQAGGSLDHGYTIADDDSAQMWSEFNRLGGWTVLGFPASRRFAWHGLLSQATQREVLQWSPITGQVEFANVLDLMHEQGRDDELRRLKQIPPPLDVDEAGLPYETIAARRLAWLDARPAIKTKYCTAPGGADPLELWGLPMSQPVNMSDSGGEVYVLRTQRAAFQEWVGGAEWAAPGEVTVVLAGDLAKQFNLLPPEAVIPEPAPSR